MSVYASIYMHVHISVPDYKARFMRDSSAKEKSSPIQIFEGL